MIHRGIIFDLDGTLLYTLASLARSFNRALNVLGFAEHPVNAYRYFVGEGVRRCAERCLPAGSDSGLIDRCIELQRSYYRQSWHEDTRVYEGIDELLENLAAHGVKLGVLSNKDDEFTHKCVAHFFPDIPFDAVVGYSTTVPLKPDPAGGNLVAEQFRLPPREVVYVGDSGTDMKTARACNMLSVGVLWGFRERQELLEAGAHHLIARPSELLDLLQPGIDK